ncbi:MAG: glycoside hydrolase family 127 protein [Asticcacaulis sp.]|uniref:beta-L-arabinofuranosidase domain-containing protein n=1 Tax=Asticcacaulis sp. TaxID=1872648 RepID=UPI0039E2C63E
MAGSAAAICACGSAHGMGLKMTGARVRPPLDLLERDQVQLGDGPLREQFDYQRNLFLNLDDDKLLKPFRQRAGLPAPGEDMGGWYDDSRDFFVDPNDWSKANWHGYIPGHSFGQYISGLARGYAVTGDAAVAQKVRGLVMAYAPTVGPKFFEGYYLPAYTYDKLAIGLIDAYRYTGVDEAKGVLDKLTDSVLPFLPEKALTREERRQRPYTSEADIWDEPYTLPENLFLAWQLGMGERYRAMALQYMQDEALFDPLAKGISPLKGKHAYSHVNALNSAIEAYYVTGEAKYLAAAKNGFDFVLAQSYATGGWGPNEELVAADDSETLYTMLSETHRSFETPCGAYGHFKVARHLLQITKDSRYGDSMERVLYNTILGAKPTLPDGSTFYYSDYNQSAHKFFRDEKWPCCSGTFIQLTADYGTSAYVVDAQDLYVNLYVPSTVSGLFGGEAVKLTQATAYPLENTSRLTVSVKRPAAFGLQLRIPVWAGKATRVTVNGKAVKGVTAGRFLEVRRTWREGDVVEIAFDMGMRLEPLNAAHPEMVALLTGPLVLMPIGATAALTRDDLLAVRREGAENWRVKAATLKPFMAIKDETYRVYTRVVA